MKVFLFWGWMKPTPGGPNECYLDGNRGGWVRADSEEEVEGILREFMLAHGWTIVAKEEIFEVTLEFAKKDSAGYEAYLEAQRNGVYVCFRSFEITEDDIAQCLGPEFAERYRMKRRGLLDKDASIVPPGSKIFY